MQHVAKRVREARQASGFTMQQIADKMECHYTRICDLEACRNDFKISTVLRFCAALKIDPASLFTGMPAIKGRKN